jgi:hypothetical protein
MTGFGTQPDIRELPDDLVVLGFLNRLKNANDLAAQHQARRGRGVMNDHRVERSPSSALVDGMKPQS